MITTNFKCQLSNFPVGETQIILETFPRKAQIEFQYERDQEIVELSLLCHTLKMNAIRIKKISIPYLPFSRQDRVNKKGECFSLKWFLELINTFEAEEVEVVDPHSDVATALIKNVSVVQQHEIFKKYFKKKDFYLVSPDAGALKKIYKLAREVGGLGVVECSKLRNTKTGQITETKVNVNFLGGKDCYIVDDICDGGRTFIEIAKILKKKKAGKIILMVSHGFFTKGLKVFDGLIDEIYDRKGRLK